MNTKNVSRGMASKLQKTLLSMLVVLTLLGSFPVNNAHAATMTGGVVSSVYCKKGYYDYGVAVNGAYANQWVAIRFLRDTYQNGIRTSSVRSGWTVVQAQGPYTNIVQGPVYIQSGTIVQVWTEVWYWNSLTRQYDPTAPVLAIHYDYLSSSAGFSMSASSSYCKIW